MLVLGSGASGLLVAQIAAAQGIDVHLMGRSERSRTFAGTLGFEHVWTRETLPELRFDAVVDASNSPDLPALALDLVEPGRRVVYIGPVDAAYWRRPVDRGANSRTPRTAKKRKRGSFERSALRALSRSAA